MFNFIRRGVPISQIICMGAKGRVELNVLLEGGRQLTFSGRGLI